MLKHLEEQRPNLYNSILARKYIKKLINKKALKKSFMWVTYSASKKIMISRNNCETRNFFLLIIHFSLILALSSPLPLCAGDSTNLRSNTNIYRCLKFVRENIAFTSILFKEHLIIKVNNKSFLMISRLIDFCLLTHA